MPEALNLREKKVRNCNELLSTGNDFLGKTQALRTINKWDLMKLKGFCMTKDEGI